MTEPHVPLTSALYKGPPLKRPGAPPIGGPRPAARPAQPTSSGLLLPAGIGHQFKSQASGTEGRGFLLIGPPGIGKSSFCAHMPAPVFICDPLEAGILDLVSKGSVPMTSDQVLLADNYDNLLLILKKFAQEEHSVKSIVLEGWTNIERSIMNKLCISEYAGKWSSFQSFQAGPKATAGQLLPEFLNVLQLLRMKGINVAITAHTQVKATANAEGADYSSVAVATSSKEMLLGLQTWMENIIYLVFQVQTNEDKQKKVKVAGGTQSIICQRNGVYEGKNKFGIQTAIDLDGKDSKESYTEFCNRARLNPRTLKHI